MKKKKKRSVGRPSGMEKVESVHRAVIDVLSSQGYDGLSIEAVASAAGVNKTSIYRRWATRDELIQHTLLKIAEDLRSFPAPNSEPQSQLDLAKKIAMFLQSDVGKALFYAAVQPASPLNFTFPSEAGKSDTEERLLLSLIAGAMIHRMHVEKLPLDLPWIKSILSLLKKG